jgi:hypothetical protein
MPLVKPQFKINEKVLDVEFTFDSTTPQTAKLVVSVDRMCGGEAIWRETEFKDVGRGFVINLFALNRSPNAILPGAHLLNVVLKDGTESTSETREFNITEETISLRAEAFSQNTSELAQRNRKALDKLTISVDELRGLYNAFPKKATVLDEAAKTADDKIRSSVSALRILLEKKIADAQTQTKIDAAANAAEQLERVVKDQVQEALLEGAPALKASIKPDLNIMKDEIEGLRKKLDSIINPPIGGVHRHSGIPNWLTAINILVLVGVLIGCPSYIAYTNYGKEHAPATIRSLTFPVTSNEPVRALVSTAETKDGKNSTTTTLPEKFSGASVSGIGNSGNIVLGERAIFFNGSNMPAGIFGDPFWKPWPSHMKVTKTSGIVPSDKYPVWKTDTAPSEITVNDGEVIQFILRPGCSMTPDANDAKMFRIFFGNNVECHEFKGTESPVAPPKEGGPTQCRIRKLPWTPGPVTLRFAVLERLP